MLRIDAARSCEDLLVELTGQVGSSRSFDMDKILPFRQAILNFISMKKSTLPETSLELLREVDREVQSMASSSAVEQNVVKEHENNQSLCNANHLHSNVDKPRLPTVSTEPQPESSTNLANETEIGHFQPSPIKPTVDLDQPCASDSGVNNQRQEDAIDVASVGARSAEKNPFNLDSNKSVAAGPASASCNATLQGNIAETLSNKDIVNQTTVVQSQPCEGKSPKPPLYNDVIKRPHNDGTDGHLLKDPSHESQTMQDTMAPALDRSTDILPTNTSEARHLPELITTKDTTQLHNCKTHVNHLPCDSGQKVNQDRDGSIGTHPVEGDTIHEELTRQADSVISSVSFNNVMQGHKSENNHLLRNTTEHTTMLKEPNGDKSQLEVSCAEKDNHGISEQNVGKNTTEVPNSSQDGDGKGPRQDPNKKTVGKTAAEKPHAQTSDDSFSAFTAARLLSMAGKMPFCSQDQEANGSLGVSSEQDLCIKCGKDGLLLQCSSCLLSAHGSCFGSSVTLEDSGQFYCPVCFCAKATDAYQKAKKTYMEARKNLANFLGTEQLLKQHDERRTGVLPRAANSEGQLNGCNLSKRQNSHPSQNLAHQGEESDRQRKKQKIDATRDACNEVVIEKASSIRNSDLASMNKQPVLQNISNQVEDQELENTGTCEDAANGYSSRKKRDSSQKRCSPHANQEVEAGKTDAGINSHRSEDSDEIEATSSDDSGNRSSPPWRKIQHHKTGLQEKEAILSSNTRKPFGQKDQHMPSPSRKRNYACPPKRYSNPAVPCGRRSKLCWTEEEEATLREAMEKFTPRNDGPIPWVQILEHGRDVFHRTRLPSDLRVKWRNMKKKSGF